MTAVASPPSVQPLPRWNAIKNGGENMETLSAEEVTRSFLPRKTPQRQNSSSSSTSNSSSSASIVDSTSEAPAPPISNSDSNLTNGDQGGWGPRKKATKLWPTQKADPARNQLPPPPSSGQSAASNMNSMMQQPSSGSLAQQSQPQQNGIRQEHQAAQRTDATPILALKPLTGTFERKHIIVPFFPEVQKIGRQTNQKTIPALSNGYFDSKVLSRQHAEIWADRNGKIWVRDVKSSNGTFVNGVRLSPENKESDPHELREGDTLELGIDIVSEDQKSIVHHKVSAKVELAGLYNTGPNMLDIMHMDPATGQPLMGDLTSQQAPHLRGRGGSQDFMNVNGRTTGPAGMPGNSANILSGQRQMNPWMHPTTIEQVVKKLGVELRRAKQQSHDLNRTSEFFTSLLNREPGQEPPKSPPKIAPEAKQGIDGSAAPPIVAAISPFSQPPAPPPSQPLPEKPNSARFTSPESFQNPGLRRTETERPNSTMGSPTRPESQGGQIVPLLEALKSARQEIDSQGDRMKYLEGALKQERKARELAEQRARALSKDHPGLEIGIGEESSSGPPLDSLELIDQRLPNGHLENGQVYEPARLNTSPSMETLKESQGTIDQSSTQDPSPTTVQDRYDLLKQEFDDMKVLMETYKRRADEAEQSQRRFAELVENIRAGRRPDSNTTSPTSNNTLSRDSILIGSDHNSSTDNDEESPRSNGENAGAEKKTNHILWPSSLSSQTQPKDLVNGSALGSTPPSALQDLEKTVLDVLQQQQLPAAASKDTTSIGQRAERENRLSQSAPYVSMVGVVLIGVGLMTWLNGWQNGGGGGVGGPPNGKVLE